MTTATAAPARTSLATMKPPKAPAPISSFINDVLELDVLQVAAGTDKHRRVIILITECIANGVRKPSEIAAVLVTIGRDRGHVWRMLREGTGMDPVRYHWWSDADGNLHLHQAVDA